MSKELRDAENNLKRLREELKNEPELLACYEPSAIYLVNTIRNIEKSRKEYSYINRGRRK